MTVGIGPSAAWSRRRDEAIKHRLQSLAATTVLLLLCSLATACSLRATTFELPLRATANRDLHPWRVGVIVEKEFTPYTIQFRYWSSTPFTWALDGLPDAFVATLSRHFLAVEALQPGRSLSTGRHDLIARMAVDRIHFDGANTTGRRDRVDLTMTFTVEQPDGTEVFRTTVSSSGSHRYTQPCGFCKPDPRPAYTEAFGAAFGQLSETLSGSRIEIGPEKSDVNR